MKDLAKFEGRTDNGVPKTELKDLGKHESYGPHRYSPPFGEDTSWDSRNSKCVLKFGTRKLELILDDIPFVIGRMKKGTEDSLMSDRGSAIETIQAWK